MYVVFIDWINYYIIAKPNGDGSYQNLFHFWPLFIIQSVHSKAISTTYAVEPKILHYLVHVLHSNITMDILQSYVHVSDKWYLRKSVCFNLFDLLGSSSSSSVDASLFGRVVVLSQYLTINFVISSLFVGTF